MMKGEEMSGLFAQQLSFIDDDVRSAPDYPNGMTQAEVDRCILTGGGTEKSRGRILEFFKKGEGNAVHFLKNEYGMGGKWPCFYADSREKEIAMDYDAKGITLHYCANWKSRITIPWQKVAKIIERLIQSGEYMED